MSRMFRIAMETVIKNSNLIEQTIQAIREDLVLIRNAYNKATLEKLSIEKVQLDKQVQSALKKLIQIESAQGIKQIPVPVRCAAKTVENVEKPKEVVAKPVENVKTEKKEKEKKKPDEGKKEKKQAESSKKKPEADDLPVDVGRLDLRVGKILKAEKHPDADSLYVSQIECGDAAPRTVVSGLVKHVPIGELQQRMVVVLCNLKPAKMRGVLSEAMVMCASTPEKVEVLSPPEGAAPGDPVQCEGYTRQPDAQLNPKKKIFETVAPDLKTNDSLHACYMGKPLIVNGKNIVSKSLKNVQIK